jgi:hypothetical protein
MGVAVPLPGVEGLLSELVVGTSGLECRLYGQALATSDDETERLALAQRGSPASLQQERR